MSEVQELVAQRKAEEIEIVLPDASNYQEGSDDSVIVEDASDLQDAVDGLQGDFFAGFEDLVAGENVDIQRINDAANGNSDPTVIIPEDQIENGNSDPPVIIGPDEHKELKDRTLLMSAEEHNSFRKTESGVRCRLPKGHYREKLPVYTPKRLGRKLPPHYKFHKK